MKKRIFAAVAAGLFCVGVGGTAFGHGVAATVDSVDGTTVGTYSGSIGSNEADWYAFEGQKNQTVTIDLTGNYDTYVYLYKTDGPAMPGDARADYELIDFDDDGGAGLNSYLTSALSESGDYVVAVEGFASSNGSYTVDIALSRGPSECPTGWFAQWALGPDDPFDRNGDGWICTKDVPADNDKAQGNSANSNRAQNAGSNGHADGHNHMDNRV